MVLLLVSPGVILEAALLIYQLGLGGLKWPVSPVWALAPTVGQISLRGLLFSWKRTWLLCLAVLGQEERAGLNAQVCSKPQLESNLRISQEPMCTAATPSFRVGEIAILSC